MRHFFLKKLRLFVSDKYCWISCIFGAVLLGFHIYMFIDSGFRIEPLLRVIYYSMYPFVIFFLGRDSIIFLFLLFGFSIEQFTDFTNYTAFFIIVFFLFLHPRFTIPVIAAYIIDVVVVCEHHDKTSLHLAVHFINCGFIYLASKIIFRICTEKIKASAKKLNLDETDRYILTELSKGAKQKEIDGYSENTVSKRLKRMRERNFCDTNSDLLMLFISEIQ